MHVFYFGLSGLNRHKAKKMQNSVVAVALLTLTIQKNVRFLFVLAINIVRDTKVSEANYSVIFFLQQHKTVLQ